MPTSAAELVDDATCTNVTTACRAVRRRVADRVGDAQRVTRPRESPS